MFKNIITNKRDLLKMRFILFASIMLMAGFFLLFTASNSLAATYTVDISNPTVDVTYVADFTSQGFDPSTEEVISGSLYLMVRASCSTCDTSFTITLENNERAQMWAHGRYYQSLSLTMADFTLIQEDGTIEYILTDYSGWGYRGAGAFTIVTSEIVPDTVELPETGQTTSYATGDDGEIQSGVSWPATRFTDNADGTVTDGLTGLVWLQDASCLGVMIWSSSLSDANALADGTCGLTDGSTAGDWRLPNVNELESLVNAGEADSSTWLNGQGFTNVLPAEYWSSTTHIADTDTAWSILMNTGPIYFSGNKTANAKRVWAVRGESTTPAQLWKTGQTTSYAAGDDGDLQEGAVWLSTRFTDNGDGTVSDGLTGLVWLQNANCFGNSNWLDSLSDANTLADGACGLTDSSAAGEWRLPNRKELRSLIDYSQSSPGLLSGHPFSNLEYARYWTSTTAAASTGSAWHVTLNGVGNGQDGLLSYHAKSQVNTYRSLPVRTGAAAVPAPDITVDITNIPFGNITVNTSSDQTVTITNDGDEDLNIGQINSISAPFSILNDNCSNLSIIPTVSCTFDVRFSPTAVTTYNNSLNIPSDDPDENPITVNVSGTGTAATAPDINVTDSLAPVDNHQMPFGNITEGTSSAAETVTIANTGNASLSVTNIQLTGADMAEFSLDVNAGASPCGSTTPTVAAAGSCTVTITFSPSSQGAKTANLQITSDDADEGTINVALSGTGTALPVPNIDVTDSIAPDSDLEMPFVDITEGLSSAPETVTISNTGNDTLEVTNIQLTGANTGEFSLDVSGGASPCGSTAPTLAAGSCTVTVTFSPLSEGAKTANLEITSDDPDDATVNVALSGTGMSSATNQDPSQFNLVSPADGQVDVSYPTTFTWEPSTDPDGDPVTYDFYNCTDPDPVANCSPTDVVASLTNDTAEKIYYAGFGYGSGIMLFGILLAGAVFGRKKAALWGIIGMIVITSAILPSCGAFDTYNRSSTPAPATNNNISFTVPSGQTSNTTYYWTVVAKDDTDGETQSSTWSYTTE